MNCHLLCFWSSLLCAACGVAQSQPYDQRRPQQTRFGVEEAFQRPVSLPAGALQSLRAGKASDDILQDCAQKEGIQVRDIPASWFVASEIELHRGLSSGLVVRGEHGCLLGAHITQFWVLANSGAEYRVVFSGRADGLDVLPTRTNGFRDLQLVFVMDHGASIQYVKFRYSASTYQVSGRRTKPSHHW